MLVQNTPWGKPQTEKIIADGIVEYTTASHGGIHLSDNRWNELIELFPYLHSWAGENWLEEDCDWGWAAIRWPHLFDNKSVYHAVNSAILNAEYYGKRQVDSPWIKAAAWLGGTHNMAFLTYLHYREDHPEVN